MLLVPQGVALFKKSTSWQSNKKNIKVKIYNTQADM